MARGEVTTLASNDAERWCAVRYEPGRPDGHVESYFLKANDPASHRALWIKFTVLSPKGRPEDAVAEVWAIVFNVRPGVHLGAKESVSVRRATLGSLPLSLQFGDSMLEFGKTRGKVRGSGAEIDWDLAFHGDAPPLVPLPSERLYRTRLPRSKFVSPVPDGRFDGRVRVGGETIDVRGWPGMFGHNWGREHAFRYAWSHCNAFDEAPAGSYFEGVSARLALGPLFSPWLSVMHLQLGDRAYRFNGPRALFASAEMEMYRWAFEAHGSGATLRGEVAADPPELVGLLYLNPAGPPTYCLNSKIAKIELRLLRSGEPPVTLRSRKAALELGVREPNHGVRMLA